MSFKKINNKQVEIITDKFDIYVEKDKFGFSLDYFKSEVKDHDKAHVASEGHEDFDTLEKQLKRLGVEAEDLAALKKNYSIT